MDNTNKVFKEYLQKRGNVTTNKENSKFSIKSIGDFYISPIFFKKESKIYELLNSYDILYSLYNNFVGNKCYHDIQQHTVNDDTLSKYEDIFNIFMNHLSNTNTIIKLYYLGRHLDIDVDINVLQRLYYDISITTRFTHFNIIYDTDYVKEKELEIVSDYIDKIKNNDEYKNSLNFVKI